eukprot:CAMPEP_0202786374 /NCGR_PEP_ID=MMETSP1388-20130828/70072_1 /ASSEMBLY_ACC=CAM_ASM_000864 /TAXON_ID=37098 /ORGANISM="Isochrysis sp, Strain CCMP1244" /LENGTH=241 /DNA_ID=CAMNT_0049455929 /DNA_START=21 /DNA_END=743 /DNA_ORIENTATION=+
MSSTREGVLMVTGLEVLAVGYWATSLDDWPASPAMRGLTILLLCANASLSFAAVRFRSERAALAALAAYAALLACLVADFGVSHPNSGCGAGSGGDDTELGKLLAQLLWTVDACLLMSILGWVTIGIGFASAGWVGLLLLGFWRLLRQAGENDREVERAIASLPTVLFRGKHTPLPLLEGREPAEATSCAICLGDFEPGEELRILPCVHLYHRACIDEWIRRKGLAAKCPLCNRKLVARRR